MEFILVAIGTIFLVLSGVISCTYVDNEAPAKGLFITMLLATIGIVLNAWAVEHVRGIPAIDVYRGNTTLQITYQDTIPVDSVVIYKKK